MGGDQSKPNPQEQQERQKALAKQRAEEKKINDQIKGEKITSNLDNHIIRKYEAKIEVMKNRAKELIADGKEKEAKKILQEATRLKKQLQSIENRQKVLQQQKFNVETHQANVEVIGILDEANEFTKQDYAERLEEHVIQGKQIKMNNDRINDIMKDAAEDEEELQEADDLLRQLQGEVIKEKKKNVAQKNISVETNKNVQKQTNKKQKNDDIDALLNQLN